LQVDAIDLSDTNIVNMFGKSQTYVIVD